MSTKFEFDSDYQFEILRLLVLYPDGYKLVKLLQTEYFDLVHHQVIFFALNRFYKENGRTPKNLVNFKSYIKHIFKNKNFVNILKQQDREEILELIDKMFTGYINDGDLIYKQCLHFISYVRVRKVIEDFDILNFNEYSIISSKLQSAININMDNSQDMGEYIFSGAGRRQLKRINDIDTLPTPLRQVNDFTNGGGFSRGSLVCVIDKQKGGKTAFLANMGRLYTKLRKRVIVFDLENGEKNYAERFEQSFLKCTKRELHSGEYDQKMRKLARKFTRLGAEVAIKRFPSGSTTKDFDNYLQECQANGIFFQICIIDYIGIMGSESGATDDTKRISDAYLDVKNLTLKWNFDITWTGHHITRDAHKRRPYKYEPTDTAKCIDINRHVDAMLGINQNDAEKEAGMFRLEVVDIRDGLPDARCYMWMDLQVQRIEELTVNQVKELSKMNKGESKSAQGTKSDLE